MNYPKILQEFVLPLTEKLSKTSIREKYKFLLESQKWSKSQTKSYQLSRLKKLIDHCYRKVPYYRELMDNLKIKPSDIKKLEDLKKFPFLTKQIVKKQGENLRAKNYLDCSFPKSTSGSTGEPTRFYQTKEDFSWIWAAHFRSWSWYGYNIGDKYCKLSVHNDRRRFNKKLQDLIFRCLYIHVSVMERIKALKHINQIFKYKPKLIYGYSSTINHIATILDSTEQFGNVKAVVTTGDNLRSAYRKRIEGRFKCKVYDEYGCGGEGLYIAAQCEEGSYHIMDELMIVEIINGEVVVTSLNNLAMPLIRYKPGDLAVKGRKCKCGREHATLARLDGRIHEVIRTPTGKILNSPFFELIMEEIPGIDNYRIIQKKKEGVEIQIVKDKNYITDMAEKTVRNYIKREVNEPFSIKFTYVKEIIAKTKGKVRIIYSSLK